MLAQQQPRYEHPQRQQRPTPTLVSDASAVALLTRFTAPSWTTKKHFPSGSESPSAHSTAPLANVFGRSSFATYGGNKHKKDALRITDIT